MLKELSSFVLGKSLWLAIGIEELVSLLHGRMLRRNYMESRMLRNGHVRFGGRPAETHPQQCGQGAAGRPYTEHWTREGKLYLCAFKDVCSNRIVGYAIDTRMKASLAV